MLLRYGSAVRECVPWPAAAGPIGLHVRRAVTQRFSSLSFKCAFHGLVPYASGHKFCTSSAPPSSLLMRWSISQVLPCASATQRASSYPAYP